MKKQLTATSVLIVMAATFLTSANTYSAEIDHSFETAMVGADFGSFKKQAKTEFETNCVSAAFQLAEYLRTERSKMVTEDLGLLRQEMSGEQEARYEQLVDASSTLKLYIDSVKSEVKINRVYRPIVSGFVGKVAKANCKVTSDESLIDYSDNPLVEQAIENALERYESESFYSKFIK